MQIPHIPSVGLGSFVADLAKQYGISFFRTESDVLADVITCLADDEVTTDATEDLIVALRRADVIDGPTMVTLLGRHFDETRHA